MNKLDKLWTLIFKESSNFKILEIEKHLLTIEAETEKTNLRNKKRRILKKFKGNQNMV
jgi:hypothetical protein